MSPTEFTVRMVAVDERFAQALKRDDIREMRAALAEKTALLEVFFAAPASSRERREGANAVGSSL